MKKFEKPSFSIAELDLTRGYGKFTVEPLERGFGTTIGNALRRVLMSSLPGVAMCAIEVEGAQHEFSALEGIQEDVTSIILNLKDLVVEFEDEELTKAELKLKVNGSAEVTAANIEAPYGVKVVNKELYICTVAQGGHLDATIHVKLGRGYISADENKVQKGKVGIIATDSNFSPIKKVAFEVEGTRVGHDSSYDRLILEVVTDESMAPQAAVALASKILIEHFELFTNLDAAVANKIVMSEATNEKDNKYQNMSIEDLDLSVRSYNCLKRAGIQNVDELIQKTEEEMMKVRNLGKKSLKEVKEVLGTYGLGFRQE